MTLKNSACVVLTCFLFVGCASVKMEGKDASNKTKQFAAPSAGNAGLYTFREGGLGGRLKKDIFVDGKCVGESAPKVFFYTEVAGGKEHEIATESKFSVNKLKLMMEAGKNYFVRQYMTFGLFVGGANLEVVSEEQGKQAIEKLELATGGSCSKAAP